ncbi:hypothetical protein JWJ90_05075 [Desulfobulbus rhabdoformis]|uniref:hypothetical protein n=1 Tax=Desulfobulbus rhabdoformis TaxID=34032 RepID=UPI00196435C6|nr:hypothetical protein [Desulfobulbus rhabdoformis]MBM9613658.1 hypothetical protein [Desulfobulbus rhabdoformis]
MLPINPLPQFLTHIQKLIPANGVLLVGAGSGTGQWITWLQKMEIQSALLIEADSKNYIQLEAFTQHVPGWLTENSIIAETQKNATFHIVGNRLESSLLPPYLLQKLWPNINSIEDHSCQTVTLDNICKKNKFVANWLIIDCLPSLAILRGSIKGIDDFDVIVVRMVLNQKVSPNEDAGQKKIDSFLQDNGYRCVEKEHERHPDLAHGLYIRDYKLLAEKRREQIQQFSTQKNDQKKLANDRLDQIENLKNRLKRQVEEHQRQIEQLNSQKDTQEKLAQDRLDQTESLKNRLKQQVEEHQKQIEQLNSQKDTQEKLAQDRLTEIKTLRNKLISPEQREQERIRLEARVASCCSAQDPHSAIDDELEKGNLSESEKIHFLFMVSDAFYSQGDKMTALHYLRMPLEWGSSLSMLQKNMLVSALISQGRAELAADIVIQDMLNTSKVDGLKPEEQMAIRKAYSEKIRLIHSQKEHGHDLLLSYLEANLGKFKEEHGQGMPVFIEIGTTRENVPGQGSTRKISMFCKKNKLTFITVDMDPHNTLMAQRMFSRLGVNAKAITAKGEDFLRNYEGGIDFVFLDAYDFDHGGHSSLRQSRYEQFLGKRIDDKDCHKMHLDCVKSIIPKLSKNGIICLDDTWTENGIWMAKGTLAVPYLIEQGFIILEARNRAALLIKPEQ